MRNNKFMTLTVLLFCALSFMSCGAAGAEDIKIKSVVVKNNKAISEPTILSKIKMKPGDVFNREVMNDDLKRLYAIGYFQDVSIDTEETVDGVIVTISVEEKPIIESVEFAGNSKMSKNRLQKAVQTKAGDMLNYSTLSQDINAITTLYSQNGFHQVSAEYRIETDKDTGGAIVTIVINENMRMRIKRVSIEGNKAVQKKVILDMMKTRPAWLFDRGYLDEEAFSADLEKIKRYYQDSGYLDAAVDFDIKSDDKRGLIYITLKITEGPLYTTGDISLAGNLIFTESELLKKIHMKAGQPFGYSKMNYDMESLREFYYARGYMNVEIDLERKVDPATHRIDLVYNIEANDIISVGKIEIKGNTKTKDVVIRRELRLYPGERFDGDKLRRSKERLYNLGFFEDVYFDTTPSDEKDVRDLTVSVKETKTGEFAFGGGYSSVDEFIGFVQISQRNFDLWNWPNFTGDGQDLSLRANLGTVRMEYELSWTEPWIFDYPLSFGFDAYNRTHQRKSDVGYGYKEMRSGGDVRFAKEFTDNIRGDLMYKLENVNISDLADDATQDLVKERGENWISAIDLAGTFDTRDNIYTPKKGFIGQASWRNAGGFLGFDKSFWKIFLSSAYYMSFYERFTLELKGRTGIGDAYGKTDDIPIYERYYAGGAETIRGYKERRVGPRDPGSNDPLGGDAVLLGNVELSFPLYEKVLKGAIFYDVGNVWGSTNDFFKFEGGMKQGVGAGIRVKTPIGPLKLDAGYPLNDNNDDKKQIEWYFSVSHGF